MNLGGMHKEKPRLDKKFNFLFHACKVGKKNHFFVRVKMITLKHGDVGGARGSLRTPKIDYIIYGPPLMAATDNDNI